MLKTTIQLLEYRIQQEEYSARIYEQMSLWFEDKGLLNLAKLYSKYKLEEIEHSGWAKTYLLSFGIVPRLSELKNPNTDYKFNNIIDVLELTLKHEVEITKQCNELAKYALQESDFNLFTLAQKYNEEQVEELEKAYTLIDIYAQTDNNLIFDQYIKNNEL